MYCKVPSTDFNTLKSVLMEIAYFRCGLSRCGGWELSAIWNDTLG